MIASKVADKLITHLLFLHLKLEKVQNDVRPGLQYVEHAGTGPRKEHFIYGGKFMELVFKKNSKHLISFSEKPYSEIFNSSLQSTINSQNPQCFLPLF